MLPLGDLRQRSPRPEFGSTLVGFKALRRDILEGSRVGFRVGKNVGEGHFGLVAMFAPNSRKSSIVNFYVEWKKIAYMHACADTRSDIRAHMDFLCLSRKRQLCISFQVMHRFSMHRYR